ncbi:hypothetical protein SAMN05660199_02640 [Klenkia soli]|uniref:Membrane protein involved in the export of O-antigen and teichoic acid n=1 Tax=Klenkia soli TaxID=1052260 RepID=A0A1H0MUG7_9ACTN|nr:hypothetical protein [Klenkia soli]SDO84063.1 hypothetical protein SAMN05660199_02640 [Klenkia soli]
MARLRGVLARIPRRGGNLAINQVLSGGSNILALGGASLTLSGAGFDRFALQQTFFFLALTLGRCVYEGGLAVQREVGRAVLPRSWALTVAPVLGTAVALVAAGVTLLDDPRAAVATVALMVAVGIAVCAQDALRYHLISRERWREVNLADGVWLLGVVVLLAVGTGSAELFLLGWGASALVSAGCAWIATAAPGGPDRQVTFREAWRPGRWVTLDAGLGQASLLLPLVFGQLYTATAVVGVLRLMQSSLSPVNTLYNVIALSFLGDAHRLGEQDAVRSFFGRMLRTSLVYGLITLAWCGIAFPVVWFVSGRDLLPGGTFLLLAGTLGAVTLLNAVTAPLGAGVRALNRPRSVIAPRAAGLLATVALLWVASTASDELRVAAVPAGLLVSAVVSAVAWVFVFRAARHREGVAGPAGEVSPVGAP